MATKLHRPSPPRPAKHVFAVCAALRGGHRGRRIARGLRTLEEHLHRGGEDLVLHRRRFLAEAEEGGGVCHVTRCYGEAEKDLIMSWQRDRRGEKGRGDETLKWHAASCL